jgi:hypothetical protein
VIIINACRKIDTQPEELTQEKKESDFFTRHVSNDPLVNAVMGFVKRQNEKYHFTENLINKIGYPYWDKSIVIRPGGGVTARISTDTTSTVFIPFVLDSQNVVNTTLVVNASPADTNFHFIADWQYRNREYGSLSSDTTAENVALLFMFLGKNVFDYQRYIITDTNLFRNGILPIGITGRDLIINSPSQRTSINNKVSTVTTVCIYSYYCGTPWEGICGLNGASCDYFSGCPTGVCYSLPTQCYSYDVNNDPYPPPSGSGGGGGGSGGGSGGGWTPPECPAGPPAKLSTLPECQPGWNPPPVIVSIPAPPLTDSIIAENLKKLILKAGNKPDSLYNAAQADDYERAFTFERINGDTLATWPIRGTPNSSSPNLTNNTFGFGHTHQQQVPITDVDKNQCFDGPDIYKVYKNACIDGYNIDLSLLITKDFYYAFIIVDKQKFKRHIDSTIAGSKNIYVIQDSLDAKHIRGWNSCISCSWQLGSEKGTLSVIGNNNSSISGVRVFRSPRQNINFTLLTQ